MREIWYWHSNLQKNTVMEQNGYRWFGWIIRSRKAPGSVMGHFLNCSVRASKLEKSHHRFGLFACFWWQDGTRWNYKWKLSLRPTANIGPELPGVTSQLVVSHLFVLSFSSWQMSLQWKEHGGHDIWDGSGSGSPGIVSCREFPQICTSHIPKVSSSDYSACIRF